MNFCHFTPLTTQTTKILKKWNKTPGDLITLNMCTINDYHIMYGSWDKECKKQFFIVLDHFLSFYPTNNLQNQNLKKKKKTLEHIIILHMCTIMIIISCMLPKIYSWMDIIFCHFGPFFTFFYPTNNKENQNFEKMEKAPKHIIILQMFTINDNFMMYASWDVEHDWQSFLIILDHFLPFYHV